MRATIIAIGSRGDVQPCVALGAGLQAAGHEATVATHERYRSLVLDHGVAFAPVAEGDVSQGGTTERGEQWVSSGRNLPGWVGWYADARSVAHQRLVDCIDATTDADVVIAPGLATLLGLQLSGLFAIPLIRSHFGPPGWVDTRVGRNVVWQSARPFVNRARRLEGLPNLPLHEPFTDLDDRGVPLIQAYSALVAPPEPDRGDFVTDTGWWVLDDQKHEPLSPELETFLAAGEAPVLIGFGAMIEDLPETLELVKDALARSGQRGIFLHEGFDPSVHQLPDTIFGATYAPHEQLFPRLAAVVHHGGAGTVGASLRAGLPTVVVPFFADQPIWGQWIADLGVGPEPIPRKELTPDKLAAAIRLAVTDEGMRARVKALAARLHDEDGVANAVRLIERHVSDAADAADDESPPLITRDAPTCPLCAAEGTVTYRFARDGIYGLPGRWRYRRCDNAACGVMWLDPVPREDQMAAMYDRPYYTHATEDDEPPRMKSFSDAVDKVRLPYLEDRFGYDLGSTMGSTGRTITKALVRAIPGGRDTIDDTASFIPAPAGPARFLEVGFGDGQQLDLMKALGWDVVGVDPDPKSVETVRERGLDARVGTLEGEHFDDGEFDAVYLAHLIEHVHDPLALLTECHRVLRPGGHLVVLTPNVNCHIHEQYRSAWFSLQAPFHLVIFTPAAMKAAFEQTGFTVTKGATSSRRAMVHNIGSLDLRDSSGGLPSFDGRVPIGRLVRGVGAQFGESARIALGQEVGEELVFVGQKR